MHYAARRRGVLMCPAHTPLFDVGRKEGRTTRSTKGNSNVVCFIYYFTFLRQTNPPDEGNLRRNDFVAGIKQPYHPVCSPPVTRVVRVLSPGSEEGNKWLKDRPAWF